MAKIYSEEQRNIFDKDGRGGIVMSGKMEIVITFNGEQDDINKALEVINSHLSEFHPSPKLEWKNEGEGKYSLYTISYHSPDHFEMFKSVSEMVPNLKFEASSQEYTDWTRLAEVTYDGSYFDGNDTGWFCDCYWEYGATYEDFIERYGWFEEYSEEELRAFMENGTIVNIEGDSYRIVYDF